jgi:ketosteroid isomerase-like protein
MRARALIPPGRGFSVRNLRRAAVPLVLVCLAALPPAVRLAADEPSAAMTSLADSERSFARTSVEKGIRDSFLAFFADDGIVFSPHPTVYKQDAAKQPVPPTPPPITLDWAPAWGDVSAAGDLGYTTGPYVLTDRSPQKRPPQRGYFFSVWKQQPDGNWKVVVDAGLPYEKAAEVRSSPFQQAPRPAGAPAGTGKAAGKGAGNADPEAARAAIAELERSFARESAEKGAETAYAARLDPAVRLARAGAGQLAGAEAVRGYLGKQEGKLTWEAPIKVDVARSADLAYTYGKYQRTPPAAGAKPESGYYVHVWRRAPGGDWRLAYDTEQPIPPGRG